MSKLASTQPVDPAAQLRSRAIALEPRVVVAPLAPAAPPLPLRMAADPAAALRATGADVVRTTEAGRPGAMVDTLITVLMNAKRHARRHGDVFEKKPAAAASYMDLRLARAPLAVGGAHAPRATGDVDDTSAARRTVEPASLGG